MRSFKPLIPDPALPGQDVKNLHPGFESSLVAISLPLDVVLALVFQQRLAVSLVGLPLGAFFFAFTATQGGGGEGDNQGGFHNGCWFHGVRAWIEGWKKWLAADGVC